MEWFVPDRTKKNRNMLLYAVCAVRISPAAENVAVCVFDEQNSRHTDAFVFFLFTLLFVAQL